MPFPHLMCAHHVQSAFSAIAETVVDKQHAFATSVQVILWELQRQLI